LKIHEYQAKDILALHGIPVQPGRVAYTPQEAEAIARELGGPVVIKAQVYVGGRGKAGGIQFGDTPELARTAASRVLGMDIKGLKVEKVLVTSKIDIKEEYYLGIILDRKSQAPVVMVSTAGGIDIEEVAETTPEKIIKQPIDMRWGLRPFEALDIVTRAGFPRHVLRQAAAILSSLAKAFIESDAGWQRSIHLHTQLTARCWQQMPKSCSMITACIVRKSMQAGLSLKRPTHLNTKPSKLV